MWNLEKWYRWTGLQGRIWDTDVENKRMDTKGEKAWWGGDGGVLNWAIGIDMYTLMCIKLMTNKNLQYKQTNKPKKQYSTFFGLFIWKYVNINVSDIKKKFFFFSCVGSSQHVGSSQTRAQTHVPCIGRQILNHWATREAPLTKLSMITFHSCY